jgi:hypothetical protein
LEYLWIQKEGKLLQNKMSPKVNQDFYLKAIPAGKKNGCEMDHTRFFLSVD